MKDYYYILGLNPSSSEKEIKTAYRKLSVKFHPDKNEGEKFYEERFKDIQEAYATLIDPSKRAEFDKRQRASGSASWKSEERKSSSHSDQAVPAEEKGIASGKQKIGSARRTYVLAALVLLVVTSIVFILRSRTEDGTRKIELSVEGGAGKTVFFDRFENNRPIHVDSVALDSDGRGSLHVPPLPLDFYRIGLENEQLIVALDSAESLSVDAALGSFASPASITGSTHTEALHTFYKDAKRYDEEREQMRQAISGQSDTTLIGKFNALNSSFYEQCKAFVQKYQSSPAALTALGKLNMQQELTLFKQVRESLRLVMPRSGFYAMFRDQVDRLEQQEVAMKLQEEEMKRLSNLLPIGSEAPEIRQQTPTGGTAALSELRGKVVLIDFWASWCRPCRIENPNVKRVYAKYAKKGFEIFGVSLDRDHASWVKAIQDDGLPWKQVSDLGFWNNAAAQEYGVSSIPFTVLIDRDGKILEKGLRGDELDGKLAQLLGS